MQNRKNPETRFCHAIEKNARCKKNETRRSIVKSELSIKTEKFSRNPIRSTIMNEIDYKQLLILLIPIVFILAVAGTMIIGMFLNYKRSREIYELHYRLSLAAIEKGAEPPPPPEAFLQELERNTQENRPGRGLLKGLIWLVTGVGIGITLLLNQMNSSPLALIPLGIGIAYLVFHYLEKHRRIEPDDESPLSKDHLESHSTAH